MSSYLFVYGTLRTCTHTWFATQLNSTATLLGLGHLIGKLFLVDDYPGAIDSNDPSQQVLGEVYILPQGELGYALLQLLDQYEECTLHDSEPTEYIRVIRSIKLSNGEFVNAWVYLYNHSTEYLTLIESGDFLDIKILKVSTQDINEIK